ESSNSEWEQFDATIELILSSVDPVCLAEQQFCIEFFNIDGTMPVQAMMASALTAGPSNGGRRVSNASNSNSIPHSISNDSQASAGGEAQERKNKQLREMMASIFSTLESEFIEYVKHFD